jgi:hypothetical protein
MPRITLKSFRKTVTATAAVVTVLKLFSAYYLSPQPSVSWFEYKGPGGIELRACTARGSGCSGGPAPP